MNKILNEDYLGLEKLNEYVKSNHLILDSDNNFRIRALKFKEKQELNNYMHKIKSMLISDPTVRTEKQLIEGWLGKGKDINKMTAKFERLERLYWKKMNELGEQVSKNGREDLIKELEKEVNKIRAKQTEINKEKTDLLSSSYEMQVLSKMYRYASYLALEIKADEGEWQRAFNNFETFKEEVSEEVANEALTLIALVESYARFN